MLYIVQNVLNGYLLNITRGGFSKIYSADWADGNIKYWDIVNQKWNRYSGINVALDNSSDISKDFLNEVIKIYFVL